MQYQSQTGGVEITLSELCALAFGRSNYTEEAETAHDAGSLSASAGSYYSDVQLQNTCRYAGVLIKTTGTAQGIYIENGCVTLDYTVHAAKLPNENETWTVPVRQRCLAYMLAAIKSSFLFANIRRRVKWCEVYFRQ